MLLGTPTVTTPIGAEAMHDNLNWNGFITNNYQEMIVHCTTLYQDEVCWQNAQNNGYELIKNLYDEKQFKHLFLDKLQTIKNNLTLHRNSNFIGEILNFHLNRSTEFMSRWIEEKNKK